MYDFCQLKFRQKNTCKWNFWPEKLHRKKCVEATWIIRPVKLKQKNYVETTWFFRSSKLRRKNYVETTWIFQSAKLHQKSTWKWLENLSKFGFQHINIISTWYRRRFDVVCPLSFIMPFINRPSTWCHLSNQVLYLFKFYPLGKMENFIQSDCFCRYTTGTVATSLSIC